MSLFGPMSPKGIEHLEKIRTLFGPMSPKRIERLEKLRTKGRKHYVFYWGILGWGMFVFLSTTFSYWYEKYGWHFPSRGDLYFATLVELPLWSLAGYRWGAFTWHYLIETVLPLETVRKPPVR
jgi:hypothetical protein